MPLTPGSNWVGRATSRLPRASCSMLADNFRHGGRCLSSMSRKGLLRLAPGHSQLPNKYIENWPTNEGDPLTMVSAP